MDLDLTYYLPNFENTIKDASLQLYVIVFVFIVLQLIWAGYRHSHNPSRIKGSLILCGCLVAALGLQDPFLNVVNSQVRELSRQINPEFMSNPAYFDKEMAKELIASHEEYKDEKKKSGYVEAIQQWISGKIYILSMETVYLATNILLIAFFMTQYLVYWTLYLLYPVGVAFMAIEVTRSAGVRIIMLTVGTIWWTLAYAIVLEFISAQMKSGIEAGLIWTPFLFLQAFGVLLLVTPILLTLIATAFSGIGGLAASGMSQGLNSVMRLAQTSTSLSRQSNMKIPGISSGNGPSGGSGSSGSGPPNRDDHKPRPGTS